MIFHDLKVYGFHLIIKEISKFDVKVSVIPNGLEKYMAFKTNRNLVFVDSMQLMNSSLDSLVKNLMNEDFKYLYEEFSGKFLELVKKGVYPYEYMNSFKKFSEDKLPDKCEFFSSLKEKCVSEKDYQRAKNIWNVFKMRKMGDYHDIYLNTDALLLADVFEQLIKKCLDYYGLDPCHYFSSPGLSWEAMLKMTRIELEVISDIDMHLFIGKGMRGGLSYIAKIHSNANNKYTENYDSNKESVFIMYLDANNLYGWAMTQYLPYSGFKWLNLREISDLCLDSMSEYSS